MGRFGKWLPQICDTIFSATIFLVWNFFSFCLPALLLVFKAFLHAFWLMRLPYRFTLSHHSFSGSEVTMFNSLCHFIMFCFMTFCCCVLKVLVIEPSSFLHVVQVLYYWAVPSPAMTFCVSGSAFMAWIFVQFSSPYQYFSMKDGIWVIIIHNNSTMYIGTCKYFWPEIKCLRSWSML